MNLAASIGWSILGFVSLSMYAFKRNRCDANSKRALVKPRPRAALAHVTVSYRGRTWDKTLPFGHTTLSSKLRQRSLSRNAATMSSTVRVLESIASIIRVWGNLVPTPVKRPGYIAIT